MKFTGTLIEDLMSTVERAEKHTEARTFSPNWAGEAAAAPRAGEHFMVDSVLQESWFASVGPGAESDSSMMGAA
jgi:hypothetical protein